VHCRKSTWQAVPVSATPEIRQLRYRTENFQRLRALPFFETIGMAAYQGTARNDRAKALAGVLLVHIALGAMILTGLNVRSVQQVVETLKTFDISEQPPPPPQAPPPREQVERSKEQEGAAGKKAEPSPIVVARPKILVPSTPPVAAAPVAGTGSATTAGAAVSGTGTGAGGTGTGRGGGGTGDFSGFTPARLVRNLGRGDYRALTAGRLPSGRAMVSLKLDARGLLTDCRVTRSSGDQTVDSGLCPLISRRLRFRPAMDADGNPIPYRLEYVANWSL
jgi:protein TonB